MKETTRTGLILYAIIISAVMGAYYVIERGDVLRARAISVHVTARVISPLCGNGVIDSGEQCDGTNLNNQTCAAFGYTSGNVSCNSDCTLNTSGCFTPPPPGGGGGGGGGGVPSSVTQVTFRGVAYPGSPVILLRDGQQIARVNAGPDARFELGVSGLAGGSYTFMVYAQDNNGIRSALNAFTADITNGVSTVVSGIVISPTIATDKSQVKQGDPLMVFGAAAPSSTIGLTIHSNQTITSTVMTGSDGAYIKVIDSSLLLRGDHSAMAKTLLNDSSGLQSPYSAVAFFKVGDTNVYAPTGGCMRADLNCDGKVNLVDFSILAYWYHRPLTNEAVGAGVDLSADGKIDLTDFSIMAYYWTG